MKFANHLFISYAHVDNARTEPKDPGWVGGFHNSLKAFLATGIGELPVIWRDPKLQGNDVLSAGIEQELPKTALLVSILSPRYLDSKWCRQEIDDFSEIAESHGGL